MTLPLPLSQDKEATWHPLEAGSGRNTSTPYSGVLQECGVSPPLSKDGETDNNNTGGEDFTYLRHLELEPLDPLTGLPIHPGIAARGGRTPCTVTRTLVRPYTDNPVPWGFSLSWCRPPRVERVNTGSAAERVGLRPGDYVIFIDSTNVVTQPQEKILELIKAATNKLVLEVYRKGGFQGGSVRRPSSVNVAFQQPHNNQHHSIAFTAEAHPNLGPDATPEEELSVREMRYWMILKSGQLHYVAPLAERQDVLSAADHMILFQNFDELLKLSEEIKDEGGGIESYVMRVPRITAAYRRYLSGLQRACCLLVALRKNAGFEELVSEQTIPQKPKPDITGILLQPLEHYREMTRLLVTAFPRNCQKVRDLSQGYREATANAGVMEPPQDTGRPLLSLQEVESRLVFAKCKPFSLTTPGRQWLFGGALAKVEGRTQMQPIWALLLTDLLVFARVLRNRVLSVTEEPLWISNIAEACFNVRKSPTEFRLSVNTSQTEDRDNKHLQIGNSGGCSPHSRPQRRILILRAPSLELKAVWHNLLQRQLIYVNGCGGPREYDPLQECLLPTGPYLSARDCTPSPEIYKSAQQLEQEPPRSIDAILKNANHDSNHLSRWVQNSNQIPPDHDVPIEEWTAEELVARTPRDTRARQISEGTMEDSTIVNSDVEQQSSTSSASMSTVRSSHLHKKSGSYVSSKENSSGSINICKRCHKSGCPTPPLSRDPFSPLPPKISVLPPTPDLCSRHRLRNGLHDSPGRGSPNCSSFDGNTEDGSEDDLDCDGETPYKPNVFGWKNGTNVTTLYKQIRDFCFCVY